MGEIEAFTGQTKKRKTESLEPYNVVLVGEVEAELTDTLEKLNLQFVQESVGTVSSHFL
jgi:hypothetical protein